jgi:copper transport protein
VLLLVFAVSVFPHAKLETSEPKAGEVLEVPPKFIKLVFSVAIQPSMSAIKVIDEAGAAMDVEVSGSDGNKVLSGPISELRAGKYSVEWRALSADDHVIKGDFRFEVYGSAVEGVPAAPLSTPEMDHSQMDHSAHEPPESINWIQSVIRWMMYVSMLALAGGFAFRQMVVRTTISGMAPVTGPDDRPLGALAAHDQRLLTLALVSTMILIAAGIAALIFQSSAIFETGVSESISPSQLQKVVTETSFGPPWLLQMSLAGAALLIVIVLRARGGSLLWWVALGASAIILVTPSLTGHARAASADYSFAIVSGWLHLVSAAVWVGGLVQIAVSVPPLLKTLEGKIRLLALSSILANFNKLAMTATALIVITGLYNTWIHVESLTALFSSEYGVTLLAKVGVSLAMVGLGGFNAFVLHPKIKAWTAEVAADGELSRIEVTRLQQSVRVEVALAAVVLLLAAILAFLPPAREHSVQSHAPPIEVHTSRTS